MELQVYSPSIFLPSKSIDKIQMFYNLLKVMWFFAARLVSDGIVLVPARWWVSSSKDRRP